MGFQHSVFPSSPPSCVLATGNPQKSQNTAHVSCRILSYARVYVFLSFLLSLSLEQMRCCFMSGKRPALQVLALGYAHPMMDVLQVTSLLVIPRSPVLTQKPIKSQVPPCAASTRFSVCVCTAYKRQVSRHKQYQALFYLNCEKMIIDQFEI